MAGDEARDSRENFMTYGNSITLFMFPTLSYTATCRIGYCFLVPRSSGAPVDCCARGLERGSDRLTTSAGGRRGRKPMEFRRPVALNSDGKEAQPYRRSQTALVPTQIFTLDVRVSEPCKPLFLKVRRRERNIATERPRSVVREFGIVVRKLDRRFLIFCPQITLLCDCNQELTRPIPLK